MESRDIAIQGIVQGVGFRPFVHVLATRLALRGRVRNGAAGVWIAVEGQAGQLDEFLKRLSEDGPPLAQIESLEWKRCPPRGFRDFRIEPSRCDSAASVFISPDIATCEACLAELLSPGDPRHGYAFINCAHCGPRLTIVLDTPYDRERTTMQAFAMCPRCRAEYEDPSHRRFHAQPTACPVCGPRLEALDQEGDRVVTDDPLRWFADAIDGGRIGAVKGLGGYHLACKADDEATVNELRRRKGRDDKPFAVMVRNIASAEALCEVSEQERALLASARRPVVLLRRRSRAALAQSVAPGNPFVGVMLPYTPLHHLLLRAVGEPLVMTSGNRTDEPIVYRDEEARERLAGLVDVVLTHNRPIHTRVDDSVTRVVAGRELPVRRSRGYAPLPITLPSPCSAPVLAVGGQLKATFGLGREGYGFLSHHLGDLDHYAAARAFVTDIALYEQMLRIQPEYIAHDLHPDYASTQYARQRGEQEAIPVIGVQHHHAHLAACMAENRVSERVIGVILDGAGYGPDGTVWGGEFLVGDCKGFERAAHLRCVGMPGGEQAVREPWRMALAHLVDAGQDDQLLAASVHRVARRVARRMLERGLNTPQTSSAGRLFDAIAAMAGVRNRVTYEGQAAVALEWLAMEVEPEGAYPVELQERDEACPLMIDTRPLIDAVRKDVLHGVDAARIARRFHSAMVEMIAAVCARLRQSTGLNAVALSGGVFQSALLTEEVTGRLGREGFDVYRHEKVPPNDGGLSLGQLAVAAARQGAAVEQSHRVDRPPRTTTGRDRACA